MANRIHSDTRDRIESISYQPGLPDSGDLESGTRTVSAAAEAVGLNQSDYSVTLTIPAPADSRLHVLRIAARLAVTIDSLSSGRLYCRVYADSQESSRRLFDLNWSGAGAQLAAVDTHSGALAAIFNLLKDGQAHTFYFYFWTDGGSAVISLCQLWTGVGTCDTGWWGAPLLAFDHCGMVSTSSRLGIKGNGAFTHWLTDGAFNQTNFITYFNVDFVLGQGETTCLVKNGVQVNAGGTVSTDLVHLFGCSFVLQNLS